MTFDMVFDMAFDYAFVSENQKATVNKMGRLEHIFSILGNVIGLLAFIENWFHVKSEKFREKNGFTKELIWRKKISFNFVQ